VDFIGSTMRNGKLLVATAFVLSLLSTSSFAYTPEQQQVGSGDAMRLCGEYIPDVNRITACVIDQYSALSDGCKSVFGAPQSDATAASTVPTAKPAIYKQTTKPAKPLAITPNLKRS